MSTFAKFKNDSQSDLRTERYHHNMTLDIHCTFTIYLLYNLRYILYIRLQILIIL